MAISSKTGLGGVISISATRPTAYTEAAFTDVAVVYDVIENVVSGGRSTGVTYGTTSFVDLTSGETVENKTSISAQEFTLQIPEDTVSAGRTTMDAALASTEYHTFKIVNGSGNTKYFEAYVTAKTYDEGDTENTEMASYTIKPRALPTIEVLAA
jgi:hypothetical protein